MPTYHRTWGGHIGNWVGESTAWLREAYAISKPESLLFMDNVRPSLLRDLLQSRPVRFLVFRPYYAPSGMNMHNYAVGACRKLDEYLTQPLVRQHLDNGTLIVKFFNEPNIGYEGFPEGRDCLDQVRDLTLEAFRLAREHYPQVKYASPPPTPGHHDAWFAGGRDDYGHYYFHGPEGCKENPTPADVQAAIQSCKLREVFESADIISYHVYANVAVGVNGDQATWYSKRHKQYQKFINHYDKPQWIFEADMGYDEAGQVAGLLAPPPVLGHGRGMSLAPGGKDAARAESLIQPSFNQTIAHNRAVLSKWWYENVIDPDPRIEGVIHWWLCGPNEASPVWAKHYMYGAEGMHPIIHTMGSYGGVPDVPDVPAPPTPPTPEEPTMTLEDRAFEEMVKVQLRINPVFALPAAIIRENQRLGDNYRGYDIVTPEHRFTYEGRTYAMMGAQQVTTEAKMVAVAPDGNWGAVQVFRQGVADEPEIVIKPAASPNWNPRPAGTKIGVIVLHHTGGSLESTLNWFKSPASQVSSHYVIAKDGTIYQPVAEERSAWHAGKSRMKDGREWLNDYSLGYEIVNDGDGVDPYPPAQLAAVRYLLRLHKERYHIGAGGVVTHEEIRKEWNKHHPNDTGSAKNDPRGLDVGALVAAVWT